MLVCITIVTVIILFSAVDIASLIVASRADDAMDLERPDFIQVEIRE